MTTVEIKSGYGLDRATEIKMLEVARGSAQPLCGRPHHVPGAHALPKEFVDDRAGYLELVCTQVLPEVAERGLADAVDAFCEGIAFTPDEVARVFKPPARSASRSSCTPINSRTSAALRSRRFGALSADHLEYASERGVKAMAAAGTVAVLLPGAFYTLRERQQPPVELLRRHGVPIALATDCNPGSSPILSILAILNMACTLFGLTPEEALAGVTRHAARAWGWTIVARSRWATRRSRPLADPSPGRTQLLVRLRAGRPRTPGRPASYPRATR